MTEQLFTQTDTGEKYILHRSDIPVTGLEITLVEYAPAASPNDKQLMPSDKWLSEMHQPLHALECPHCLGTSRDPKRPQKPCGPCFGTGFLSAQGEALTKDTATADALLEVSKLIRHQAAELKHLQRIANDPDVKEVLLNKQWAGVGDEEEKWRNSPGHGPAGARQTSD